MVVGEIDGFTDSSQIVHDYRRHIHHVGGNVIIHSTDAQRAREREENRWIRWVSNQHMQRTANHIAQLQNALRRSEQARIETEERMRRNEGGRHRRDGGDRRRGGGHHGGSGRERERRHHRGRDGRRDRRRDKRRDRRRNDRR